MDLREKIAGALHDSIPFAADGYISPDDFREAADAILQIPEIKEALALREERDLARRALEMRNSDPKWRPV